MALVGFWPALPSEKVKDKDEMVESLDKYFVRSISGVPFLDDLPVAAHKDRNDGELRILQEAGHKSDPSSFTEPTEI